VNENELFFVPGREPRLYLFGESFWSWAKYTLPIPWQLIFEKPALSRFTVPSELSNAPTEADARTTYRLAHKRT